MNIQFMTMRNNGIPTGRVDWRGNPVYKYLPNYDEMLKNASCEEERECILSAKDLTDSKLLEGFNFEIVYTAYTSDGYGKKKWQFLQHPWYELEDGTKRKEWEMVQDIALMIWGN
ncbi:MAG: hypothetical protein IIZ78_02160 [Clostridiales bacterium]|nr:hypothetical protein [Clostridiales bacterium]